MPGVGKANKWPKFDRNCWYLLLKHLFLAFFHKKKNNNIFLWFSLKTHICTMFLIKTFFIWDWKRPKNAQCVPGKGSISHLQKIYLHFSSEISCFELIFIFSPFRTYSYTTISIKKTVHNVVLKHRKTKLKLLVCHQ